MLHNVISKLSQLLECSLQSELRFYDFPAQLCANIGLFDKLHNYFLFCLFRVLQCLPNCAQILGRIYDRPIFMPRLIQPIFGPISKLVVWCLRVTRPWSCEFRANSRHCSSQRLLPRCQTSDQLSDTRKAPNHGIVPSCLSHY